MGTIKSKWDFLLQCRPDVRGRIGNAKLLGGNIINNSKREKIFHFVTQKAHSPIMKGQTNSRARCKFDRT
jgi:hypothetical protein